jgi:hypothetical protein
MKQTPFTTRSGVKIGLLYEAPKNYEASSDMERLQTSLLGRGRSFSTIAKDWSVPLALIGIVVLSIALTNCKGA